MSYLRHLSTIRKALAAAAALVGVLAAGLEDGALDGPEIVAVASAAGGLIAVFAVPNAPAEERPRRGGRR